MRYRRFKSNCFAMSIMYDAVFFITMVSISGVVLIPALTSNVAVDTSVEKHREEIVDEALLMLMTSRVDNFEYVFAGSQIDGIASVAGVDVDDKDGLYNSITTQMLGKEQVHKTYADLCVENLVSQIKIFDCRVNIFTEDYDNALKNRLSTLLNGYLGDKYKFNISVQWHPVNGISFGGELFIGHKPPKTDTYVAKSFVTMPVTIFSEWLNDTDAFIDDQIEDVEKYLKRNEQKEWNQSEFKEFLTDSFNCTIHGIIFDGFDIEGKHCNGVLNASFDYFFEKIQGSLSNIFGNAMNSVNEFLDIFGLDLGIELDNVLSDKIKGLSGVEIKDFNNDSVIDLDDIVQGLKKYIVDYAKNALNDTLNDLIENSVDDIVQSYDSFASVNSDEIKTSISDFYNKQINVLRAEFKLTIWEARE